jgi:DNA-binding LacI/PurR family transcriptional regulator
MSSQPHLLALPQRLSLAAQAASAIRNAIQKGTWAESLPGERRLCELLKVSRPTIRTALRGLAKEGVLAIRHGHRNQILDHRPAAAQSQERVIGLVTSVAIANLHRSGVKGINEMRAHLTERGFDTEVLVCPPGSARAQQRRVENFVRQIHASCCVLWSVSREIQEWFAERSFPALVLGSCHAAVKLPSLEVDYHSVCRHAVGVFLGQGHQRIAFVVPSSGVAGDLASEQGFLEGVKLHSWKGDVRAVIVRHNGTAQNISARLDALFASGQAPTALLVAKPLNVFAVVLHLLRRGLAVPGDVSLIARDHDHFFEFGDPPLSHYRFNDSVYGHRLPRLTQKLISQGSLPLEPSLVFPEFFAGGTVARATLAARRE